MAEDPRAISFLVSVVEPLDLQQLPVRHLGQGWVKLLKA